MSNTVIQTYLDEIGVPYTIEHKPFTGHPNAGRDAQGYGRRIPTDWMVQMNRRSYRVYCCCFSNSGTTYISTKDHKFLIIPNYLFPNA